MSVEGHLQAPLGCEWGRAVWTPDDELECDSRAERIVVVHGVDDHDGLGEIAVKLCGPHIERISQETTPREPEFHRITQDDYPRPQDRRS